ncbi:hypothetical protein LIX17_12800 [Mycobacterium avium subsp. hominissuis]|uniref:Tyr recombinase domain-containing protein n=3 Tax=Mycobacterium avium complex (MAC) TaxID=120793 RepID=A0AAW5S7P0_MYCBC|nr:MULTISPECIES: hypothetical protein [Mycobacterium avium complex (MAC)]ETZ57070.1 hypothetical protein L838_0463 [Mycobacterium avium MAV_120709_2344]MBG0729609.1 hypothetical protein [Mycobacterium avium]MCA2338246.1 hypothetical protein [Mycobacterium avium]MCA4731949.1 hypothetical protein [Mycobacterium avium subsp. hominissuis]MCA4736748.1 hypothetical protein [Mycobacterium avium subsp. hominissuis]
MNRQAIDGALARADRIAAERISQGAPIVGTLLSCGLRPRNVPLLRDPDVMVDIDCDDWVTVNESATERHKAKARSRGSTPRYGSGSRRAQRG